MKKGDTIQGRTLYKGEHYLRKYGISKDPIGLQSDQIKMGPNSIIIQYFILNWIKLKQFWSSWIKLIQTDSYCAQAHFIFQFFKLVPDIINNRAKYSQIDAKYQQIGFWSVTTNTCLESLVKQNWCKFRGLCMHSTSVVILPNILSSNEWNGKSLNAIWRSF